MEPDADAYGHAIRDYQERGEGFEIVERDDGWIGPTSGPGSYFLEYEDWPERVRSAMNAVRGRVVDIGCGAGRHALYLQRRGHDVVGIDISPGAVEVCRDRGLKEVRELDIEAMEELDGRFDTALLLGNNFGLIGTRDTAMTRLETLSAVTHSDGRLIAESLDPYRTDDPDHLEYHEFNAERGRLGGALRIRVRYKRYATGWFDYLLAAPAEMEAIVSGTPWRVENRIDGTRDEARYVAVLEKR